MHPQPLDLIGADYLRGFYRNGERILGMGVPAYDLIGETFTAAANVADEAVTLDAGGTEPRYRCSAIMTADDGTPHRQVLDALLSTFAGYLYDYAGSYFCQAGAAQGVVRTITDGELVVGAAVTVAFKRSRAELVNRIPGQFLDPVTWQAQSYETQVSASGAAADGEELGRQLDLLAVASQSQAERIARIRLREARAQATASLTLGFNHVDLQVGDWITWASDRFGTKAWRIVDREVSAANRAVTLNLAETNAAIFSWSAADEGAVAPIVVRPQPGTRISTVAGFDVEAFAIESGDGSTVVPALRCTWTPITDPSVDSVEIEYRIVGTLGAQKASDPTPGDGERVIADVVNATLYEARATLRCTPTRYTTWTDWIPVTTTADFFVQVALDQIDEAVDRALSDNPAITGSIGEAKAAAASALAAASTALDRSNLAAFRSESFAAALTELTAFVTASFGHVGQAYANATQTLSYSVSQQGIAQAEFRLELDVLSGDLNAQVVRLDQAITDGQTSTATSFTAVTAAQRAATDADRLNAETIAGLLGWITPELGRTGQALASLASAATSLTASTDATGRAIAQQVTALAALSGSTSARFLAVNTALSDGITALTTQYTALQSQVNDPTSGLAATRAQAASEVSTRASETGALASRAGALEATVNNPTTGLVATRAAVSDYDQASTTRDTALASRASALEASVNDPATGLSRTRADVGVVNQASVDRDSALATSITSVSVRANGISADGQLALVAIAAPTGYSAAFRLKLTANGADAGLTVLVLGDGTSRILLDASKILFGDGSGGVPGFAYDSGTHTLTITNLVVTTSLLAPNAVFDSSYVQSTATTANGKTLLTQSAVAVGRTLVPDDRGLTSAAIVMDAPGIIEVTTHVGFGTSNGEGSLYVGLGTDPATFRRIGKVASGTAEGFNVQKFQVSAGTYTIRFAYDLPSPGAPSGSIGLRQPGATSGVGGSDFILCDYHWVAIKRGTAT